MTTNERYDAITLELEKADSLAGLLEDRLLALAPGLDAPAELHALGVVAEQVTNKLQAIYTHMRALGAEPVPPNRRTVVKDLTPGQAQKGLTRPPK
jgi:hypothetical protein